MLKNILIIFLLALSANAIYANNSVADLPNPYENAQIFPINDAGWYGNSDYLKALIDEHRVQTIVEVGCWYGLSTRDIATLLPQNGKVYAVDHWLGSIEHQNEPNLHLVYQVFLSNAIQYGVANKIIPIKMESSEAAKFLQGTAVDLVYIDASHETEAVLKDLRAWYPYVQGHGVICGDDSTWETVLTAVKIFASENNLQVYTQGNFWHLAE